MGVITALPKEFVAVKAMLDDLLEWTAPGTGAGRRYVLGSVPARGGGAHIVAVALLTEMGNNSAAIRATQLLQHCPAVRHIVMCGIAGGIPRFGTAEHDLRLGDVLVSNHGGVTQYDLVKQTTGGLVEYRAPPRPPSSELLEAVLHLQAGELEGHRPWESFFVRANHLEDTARPRDDVGADGETIGYPPDPKRRPGQPRVFHGRIASANRLLKDAEHRDRLAKDLGVKGIEMEGSGIADATWLSGHAGYLVIRGICDYCDEHKGDAWQGHAAVTAATYLRALLESMAPTEPSPEDRASSEDPPVTPGSVPPSQEPTDSFEPCVVHPYSLLRTSTGLVGRGSELATLDQWLDSSEPNRPVFVIVALGGMGKSALTWHWFERSIGLAGRLWWSFYDSDASYERLIDVALAYTTGLSPESISELARPERESRLLRVLDSRRFLLVLDGFERVLTAYGSVYTATSSGEAGGVLDSHLRGIRDLRLEAFIQRATRLRISRVLISTRLYPSILEGPTGQPIPGSHRMDLAGLSDQDALVLWEALGASGRPESLLRCFRTFDKHPLLIQAFAGRVCRDRRAPRDFDAWQRNNPSFDPFSLPITQVKSDILSVALDDLDGTESRVLTVLAGFRAPVEYATLVGLLVGPGEDRCSSEEALAYVLQELEERGLVGWDNRPGVNRYDLHPVVRGVVWSRAGDATRARVYSALASHFSAMPVLHQISRLEDLTPALELYRLLLEQRRYDDAFAIFQGRLQDALQYRLSRTRAVVDLLEPLFDEELEPRVTRAKRSALRAMAEALHRGGEPGRAVLTYRKELCLADEPVHQMLADALFLSGRVRDAHHYAELAVTYARDMGDRWMEAVGLTTLGRIDAARGAVSAARLAFERSNASFDAQRAVYRQGGNLVFWAQLERCVGDARKALTLADRAWQIASEQSFERDFVRAGRIRGEAYLALGMVEVAEDELAGALARARSCDLVEEAIPAMLALSECVQRRDSPDRARELVDDVWALAEKGPYPLLQANAYHRLAELELALGRHSPAVQAATKAHRLAWRDGPPFAHHWALESASRLLALLGASTPTYG